jgi:DMSO/TMAO reductase YedYZ molybdopterin-dependent catalytic subunit
MAAAAGAAGAAAGARLAARNGWIPPVTSALYGAGESLTYAAQRLLTRHSRAREFPPGEISKAPFVNGNPPAQEDYQRHRAEGFAHWRLAIDGLVARPVSLPLAALRRLPASSQITHLACEEGWSFIAEWTGVPLFHVLEAAGILPRARYVVYFSMESGWLGSIDMADALHPQTLLAYGMNGAGLPAVHGGPLRLRVPRQLGYKSVKYLTRLTVTDRLNQYPDDSGYSWYAGI